MLQIKTLRIKGFKKFIDFEMSFNKNTNILVGENESGKSTILEAIDILLNQRVRNLDPALIRNLINLQNIEKFEQNPSYENLPEILIEITFYEPHGEQDPTFREYFGSYNLNDKNAYGIRFECVFQSHFLEDVRDHINDGKIPFEYYLLDWTTFSGGTLNRYKNKIKSLLIDTSTSSSYDSYNYFTKNVLSNTFNTDELIGFKHNFHENIDKFFNDEKFKLDSNKKIGPNHRKILLENITSIYYEDIVLEDKGKGMESLIKTEVSLSRDQDKSSILMIEEPENHLSHSSMFKIIKMLNARECNQQLIITTHNDLIASRLSLSNVIWIKDSQTSSSLQDLDRETSEYFKKLDGNNFLQFLLSERIILVEGTTEYLLVPEIYKKMFKASIEDDGIDIISCRGLSYERYLNLAKLTNKKVVVITDNDNNGNTLNKINKYSEENQEIFTDDNLDNFTWEVSLYNYNEELIKEVIKVDKKSSYKFNGVDYRMKGKPHLGKMLNNKSDSAFTLLRVIDNLNIPDYVRGALEWIRE